MIPKIINVVSSLFGGVQNKNRFATVDQLNSLINSINVTNGGSKISVVYKLTTDTNGNAILSPVHISGSPPLPEGTVVDDCSCGGNARVTGNRKPYTFTNGLRSCVSCSLAATISTAFVSLGHSRVTLPTLTPPISDYIVTINSNATPAYSLGSAKVNGSTFDIVIYDISARAFASVWPVNTYVTIDYYLGTVTEG